MSIKRIIFPLIAIAISFIIALSFWNMHADVVISPGPEYEDLNLDENKNDNNETLNIGRDLTANELSDEENAGPKNDGSQIENSPDDAESIEQEAEIQP